MNSVPDTLAGGFPHSEILGSKPVCRLPEAYRRLPRLSSPVVAKAFTVCAYSLDHITPKRRIPIGKPISYLRCKVIRCWFLSLMQHSQTECNYTFNLIGTSQYMAVPAPLLTYIHCPNCKRTNCLAGGRNQRTEFSHPLISVDCICWWSQPGSNRRPLACKASALPAELWPR